VSSTDTLVGVHVLPGASRMPKPHRDIATFCSLFRRPICRGGACPARRDKYAQSQQPNSALPTLQTKCSYA
jgi:hypothetical protein